MVHTRGTGGQSNRQYQQTGGRPKQCESSAERTHAPNTACSTCSSQTLLLNKKWFAKRAWADWEARAHRLGAPKRQRREQAAPKYRNDLRVLQLAEQGQVARSPPVDDRCFVHRGVVLLGPHNTRAGAPARTAATSSRPVRALGRETAGSRAGR